MTGWREDLERRLSRVSDDMPSADPVTITIRHFAVDEDGVRDTPIRVQRFGYDHAGEWQCSTEVLDDE